MNIKIKFEKVPYQEGLSLYFNNKKTHFATFSSLKALREFWAKYRPVICAGYKMVDFNNWAKI